MNQIRPKGSRDTVDIAHITVFIAVMTKSKIGISEPPMLCGVVGIQNQELDILELISRHVRN